MKLKKFLLSISGLLVLSGGAISASSCGKGSSKTLRYESVNDHKLIIDLPFVAGHAGVKAFEDIAKVWNQDEKLNKGYKLEIRRTEGEYQAQPGLYETKIKAKDKYTLPNIWLGYPQSAVVVNKYNMLLNFASEEFTRENSGIPKKLLMGNDHIQNIAKGGMYIVPFAQSSEALYINKIGIKKVLFDLGIIKIDDKENIILPETWTNDSDSKSFKSIANTEFKNSVIPNWLNKKAKFVTPENNIIVQRLKSANPDSIFKNYDLIFKFSELIAQMYVMDSGSRHYRALAFDAPIKTFTNLAALYSNLDENNFFYSSTGEKNKNFTWDALEKEYPEGKKAYEVIAHAVKAGGVALYGDHKYASQDFIDGNFLISTGSTAGTTYNLSIPNEKSIRDSRTDDLILPMPHLIEKTYKFDGDMSEIDYNGPGIAELQGGSLQGIHVNAEEDKMTKELSQWLLSSSVMLGGKNQTPAEYFSQSSNYITPTQKILSEDSSMKEVLNKINPAGEMINLSDNFDADKYLLGPTTVITVLKQMQEKNSDNSLKYTTFLPSVGVYTGEFGNKIQTFLKQISKTHSDNPASKLPTYSDLINELIKWVNSIGYSL